MSRMHLLGVAVFIPLFLSHAQAAKPRVDGAYLNDLRLVRETPHLEFAKPNASGSTRALFVAPQQLACREIAELMQRLDLEVDVVASAGYQQLGVDEKDFYTGTVQGFIQAEKEAELEQKLKNPHDVIVLGHFSLKALPEKLQREILRQVEEEGKGLLVVFDTPLPDGLMERLKAKPLTVDREWIYRAVPLNDLWQSRPLMGSPPNEDQLGLYQLGKGRVALLQQPLVPALDNGEYGGNSLTPVVEYDQRSPTIYQHLLSLPARALLWCANRTPATRFELPTQIKTDAGGEPLEFAVQADHDFKGKVSLTLTDQYGNFSHKDEQSMAFKAGRQTLRFPLPRLWHGVFYANLWLKDENGKTFDWGAVGIEAGKPRIALQSFSPNAQCVLQPGAPMSGSVTLQGAPALADGETVELWLKDNYERIVRKAEGKVDGQTIRFETTTPAESSTLWIEFAVQRHGEMVDTLRDSAWYFRVAANQRPLFFSTLWGCDSPGILAYWDYQAYADVGFTSLINNGVRSPLLPHLDWDFIKFAYHLVLWNPENNKPYNNRWKENGTIQYPFEAWLQADDRRDYLEAWRKMCQEDLDRGNLVRCYSYGDEMKLGARDIGFSDWWMPAFREHLKTIYSGSIENLNRSWLSSYRSFDEVRPRKSSDSLTMENWIEKKEVAKDGSFEKPQNPPKQVKTYAPYLDHRLFVENEFPKMIGATRDTLRKHNPNVAIGFEGAGSLEAYGAIDLSEVARASGFLAPYYNRAGLEVIRSFKPQSATLGCWAINYVSHRLAPGMVKTVFWDSLFCGANSLWVFTDTGSEGGMNLDLSWAPHFPVDEVRKLNSGLGEWMAKAKIVDDPVAIHYSMGNSELNTLEYPWGYSVNVHQSWIYLLNDMGYNVRYVNPSLVEAGELIKRGYRVLVLPNTVSLSAREAEEIERFARQGGLVVADLRPGVMNEHGLYLEKGQLDGLFGVTRTTTERQTRMQEIACAPVVKTASKNVGFWNVFSMHLFRNADAGGTPVTLNLSATDVDPTVSPSAGTVATTLADGVPVVCQRRVGKGEAVLLNFNVHPYYNGNDDSRLNTAGKKRGDGLRELMDVVFAKAGVKPRFAISPDVRSNEMGVRRVLFQSGNVKVLAVMRNMAAQAVVDALGQAKPGAVEPAASNENLRVKLTLGATYQVYDVLKGESLGRCSSIDMTLPHAEPRLFALLEKPAAQPDVALSPTSMLKRGGQVTVRIQLSGAGRQGVWVTLAEPDGAMRRWSQRVAITDDKGRCEISIPLAFNEKTGVYNLVVQEVLTGMRTKLPFDVK